MKKLILKQAVQLYILGIEVETERSRLENCVIKYGMSSPITIKQSRKLHERTCKFQELEQYHILATEKYMRAMTSQGKN